MEPSLGVAVVVKCEVSIPERVWGGLERIVGQLSGWSVCVSIPERVWGGLEHSEGDRIGADVQVSIPERVWGGLER